MDMKWNLSNKQTETKFIPVANCPNKKCGIKDTPLSFKHLHYKHKDTGKKLDLRMWVCPKCDTVINLDEDTWKAVKGFIGTQDLLDAGYKEQQKPD